MKVVLFSLLFICIITVLMGCETGYTRKNGDWVWVTNDENHGERSHWIEGIDQNSFNILKNKSFAKDKNQVYFKGKIVKYASPEGFITLTDDEYGYSKDNKHAFFNNEVIINADPATFEVLAFPYSKDKNDIYCGTVPMMFNKQEVASFKVTNDDELMKGMISTIKLSHFLEYNPKYAWITKSGIDIENVITGEWGTGEVMGKKYQGLYIKGQK